MRLHLLSLMSLGILANVAVAQDEITALNFSQTYMKGSARFSAMGGAFGALGGDVSSFMVNPAGVGVFRTSEFTFSMGINNANLNSKYRGENSFESRTALNIGNSGIVMPVYANSDNVLRGLNFGVAYNRVNDFGMNTYVHGSNNQNSITDYFANNTDGIYQNYLTNDYPFDVIIKDEPAGYNFWKGGTIPVSSVLAWKTGLIDPEVKDNDNFIYYSTLGDGEGVEQHQWKTIRGFNDLVNITFGGNLGDLVYFGSSLNINNINYKSTKTYREVANASNKSDFNEMNYEEDYRAYGTGYSLSVGVIAKPIQELRLGVSYQSPTWNFIDEEYSSYMNSYFVNNEFYDYESPLNSYDYRVHSPQKLTGSIAGVIGNFAIISADFDWMNYKGMKIKGDSYDRAYFSGVNSIIRNTFRNTYNIRGGAEFKLGPMALRGGYQYYQSPYATVDEPMNYFAENVQYSTNDPTKILSAGFGYRERDCYVDFAYTYMTSTNNYAPYNYVDLNDVRHSSGVVKEKIRRNSYIITIGIKL